LAGFVLIHTIEVNMTPQIRTAAMPCFSPLSSDQMTQVVLQLTKENMDLNEEVLQLRAAVMMYREVGNRLSLRLAS
jgi:hypothetical protein